MTGIFVFGGENMEGKKVSAYIWMIHDWGLVKKNAAEKYIEKYTYVYKIYIYKIYTTHPRELKLGLKEIHQNKPN